MSDRSNAPITDYDLLTVNMIDSLIARVEIILSRDLSASAHKNVQAALTRIAYNQSIELLLDKANTAATVKQFDSGNIGDDIDETPFGIDLKE